MTGMFRHTLMAQIGVVFIHIPGVFISLSLPSRLAMVPRAFPNRGNTILYPQLLTLTQGIAVRYVTNGSQTLGESVQVHLGGIHKVRARVGGRVSRSLLGDG